VKAELSHLIALQNADTNIRRLQAEIESIPERRAEIEKEFDQRAFEIRALEERRDNGRQERARLESEIFEQKQRADRGAGTRQAFAAVDCGCANACTIHGHAHAWTADVPVADEKSFWGALGCSCWAF
jgi:hypothetical protein